MTLRFNKRILPIFCALSLLISLAGSALAADDSTTTPPEPPSDAAGTPSEPPGWGGGMGPVSFSDVSESDWFYEAVRLVAARGIMNGTDGQFLPNSSTSRSDFVTYLYAAAGSPTPTLTVSSFTDVSSSDAYYNAVLWAEEQGIVQGLGSGLFDPAGSLTRAMSMVFLYRAAAALNLTLSPGDTATLSSYRDAASVDSWAAEAVASLVDAGIITGSDGALLPMGTLTNAQVATILSRILSPSTGGEPPKDGGPGARAPSDAGSDGTSTADAA